MPKSVGQHRERPCVLWIGTADRGVFGECAKLTAATARFELAPTCDAALGRLADELRLPELIVLADEWPGQHSHRAIAQLRHRWPLAGVWRLVGSWCEGTQRGDRTLPGVVRIAAQHWPARWAEQLRRCSGGQCPLWGLPATASDDERLQASLADSPHAIGQVVVIAENLAAGVAIAGGLACFGGPARVLRLAELAGELAAKTVVWDVSSAEAVNSATIAQVRRATPAARLVVVLGFPRPHEMERLTAAGVSAVVAKPYLLADLLAALWPTAWPASRAEKPAPLTCLALGPARGGVVK